MSGLGSVLFGGLGQSTNPADYQTPYQDRGQILGAINSGMSGIDSRQAPQLQMDPQAAFRAAQMQQMGQLQGIASGNHQGAGELAAQRQVQNALAAQQAQARMARGPNAALGYRNAANNAAGIGLAGAGQAQQAGLQDQMAAQGLLSQLSGQGRQQDIGLAGQNAQLQQQQYGMNDQARLGYLGQLGNMNANQLQAQQAAMQATLGQQGIMGGLLSAGGQIGAAAAMSDERVKTDIEDADEDIDEMLDKLVAKNYRYKNPRHGIGPRAGIMAQDLERSRAGSRIVREVPDGKAMDVNAALSAALASAARLNARLRKLEGKKAA